MLDIKIIENTIMAQEQYGLACGWDTVVLTEEHIKALYEGKQLAFNDGEYSTFLTMSEPK